MKQKREGLRHKIKSSVLAVSAAVALTVGAAYAADKPNIVLIVSDDFGYGDAGVYGGGPNRGMPTRASTGWPRRAWHS